MRAKVHLLALAAAIVVLQIGVAATGKVYYLTQMTMAAYYAMVVMSLCLLMGYAGQASLGHGAFLAMGGYTSAFFTTHNFASVRSSGWVFSQRARAFTMMPNCSR